MDVPNSTSSTSSINGKVGVEASATAGIGIPMVARGEATGTGKAELGGGYERGAVRERGGLAQVIREIGDSGFVVLVDDFHYMDRSVQEEVAKNLKEATRLGVKLIAAAVRHRADDVLRANPELRGRVRAIDLEYWRLDDLGRIASTGFAALNVGFSSTAVDTLARESAGSPQLMQLLCLQACFVLELREKASTLRSVDVDGTELQNILEQTSSSTDFRSLVDVLEAGPKTRGTERNTYKFKDGTEGDVYRCVLKAIAADPPRLWMPYDELLARTASVCKGDAPVGSSVTGTCVHMSKLAQEKFPNERAIDWDEQKQILDIPDPYLLFFLRWSNRLKRAS